MIVTCLGYIATPLGNGQIQLEIRDAAPDAAEARMSLTEVADMLGYTIRNVDRLSRRKKNPLPFHRGKGRPFAFRHEVNEWLQTTPLGSRPPPPSSLTRTVYGSTSH